MIFFYQKELKMDEQNQDNICELLEYRIAFRYRDL